MLLHAGVRSQQSKGNAGGTWNQGQQGGDQRGDRCLVLVHRNVCQLLGSDSPHQPAAAVLLGSSSGPLSLHAPLRQARLPFLSKAPLPRLWAALTFLCCTFTPCWPLTEAGSESGLREPKAAQDQWIPCSRELEDGQAGREASAASWLQAKIRLGTCLYQVNGLTRLPSENKMLKQLRSKDLDEGFSLSHRRSKTDRSRPPRAHSS